MAKKRTINELRQTKEYYTPKVQYNYVGIGYRDFKEKVINLRRKFPNDKDFGSAVAKLLTEDNRNFPGIQNL